MDNMNIGENDDIFNDEDGDETIKTGSPLLWQMIMDDFNNANSVELPNSENLNENDTSSKPCRNSIQVNNDSILKFL